MKFVISYSCGKDSALALHRMIKEGHTPVGLLVMMNKEAGRSWFHGVAPCLLEKIADSLGIPLIAVESTGEGYHTSMEDALGKTKQMGAECCVFGDIDIEEHFDWCAERCRNAGIEYRFPLWQQNREALTTELIGLGYHAVIKCVNNKLLPREYLGKELTAELVADLKGRGIDVCGENGEYHTVVLDGPAFRYPVKYALKETMDFGEYSAINIEIG
ncbi:diphthine--ammonia ligase [Christensenellaceae bacterium OttesenSCG-928-K19]|nr:diphthine--ammonia ligase [Christensenellaceae bacterium OttesenSCG-928-K19]